MFSLWLNTLHKQRRIETTFVFTGYLAIHFRLWIPFKKHYIDQETIVIYPTTVESSNNSLYNFRVSLYYLQGRYSLKKNRPLWKSLEFNSLKCRCDDQVFLSRVWGVLEKNSLFGIGKKNSNRDTVFDMNYKLWQTLPYNVCCHPWPPLYSPRCTQSPVVTIKLQRTVSFWNAARYKSKQLIRCKSEEKIKRWRDNLVFCFLVLISCMHGSKLTAVITDSMSRLHIKP